MGFDKNVENNYDFITISLETKRKPQKCNCCGAKTDKIHVYRLQHIKDIHSFGNLYILT